MQSVDAIVYVSQTGYSKRYAEILAQQSGLPCYALGQAKGTLPRQAAILFIGWLCAGGLKGLKQAARRFQVQAVCAVGIAPPEEKMEAGLRERLGNGRPFFYLRGGYAPERLHGVYKIMMDMMIKTLTKGMKKQGTPKPEEQQMLEVFLHGGDYVRPENLAPVLNWLQQ